MSYDGNLSDPERELFEELGNIHDAMEPFSLTEEELDKFLSVFTSEQHDLGSVSEDLGLLLNDVRMNGEFSEEDLEKLRELEEDASDLREDLRLTEKLLTKERTIQKVRNALENIDKMEDGVESLEQLSEKLDQVESSK
jgi:hypothetical protein